MMDTAEPWLPRDLENLQLVAEKLLDSMSRKPP